jgi:streptomycin 3"-adenylyltransferase
LKPLATGRSFVYALCTLQEGGSRVAQHGWTDVPPDVRAQIERLVILLRAHVGDGLVGVYLHGSLAMGCFNPARSDVDLLAVTESPLELSAKWRVAQVLLRLSGAPSPIEISILHRAQLDPWTHPAPFDLHYGESHRGEYERDLRSDGWKGWNRRVGRDGDLAGHLKVARHRGVCLWGEPIEEALPDVPRADYVASVVADLEWSRDRAGVTIDYRLLNLARAWAYLETGAVMSKDEGGVWALGRIPSRHAFAIEAALRLYRGEAEAAVVDDESILESVEYMEQRIGERTGALAGG